MRRAFPVLLLALLLAGAQWLSAPAHGAPLDGDNDTDGYLENGGFEGSFYPVGAGQVATHWSRLNLVGNPTWMSTQIFADGGWVEKIGGANSAILSVEDLSVGQPFETVLMQQVSGLTPGHPYSFSGWVLKMYGGSANPAPPADPFSYASWIGVDPAGGTDPNAPTVIWGTPEWQTERKGHWENHRLAVPAQGATMTVFVRIWLKWQRAETQAIVDAMELFDAPTVVLGTTSGPIAIPRLDWNGTLPPMIAARGNYQLYFDVQKRQSDGSWTTIAERLTSDNVDLPLAWGESVTLRVLPYALQPAGQPVNWPPTSHIGLPSAPVTVTYGEVLPTVELETPERWAPLVPIPIHWTALGGSTLAAGYDVHYRRGGTGSWSPWLSATTVTSASFGMDDLPVALAAGDEWEFRARARSQSGGVGEWSPVLRVALASARLRGRILAANGEVIPELAIEAAGYAYSEPPQVNFAGYYDIAFPLSGTHTIEIRDGSGLLRLPATPLLIEGREDGRDWYLPPLADRVTNGHFEDNLAGWTGQLTRQEGGASGHFAARLEAGATVSQTVTVTPGDGISLSWLPTPGAHLEVALGEESWQLDGGESGSTKWLHWYSPTESSAGSQTFALAVTGGTVAVDDITIGPPQPEAHTLFLPLARRAPTP